MMDFSLQRFRKLFLNELLDCRRILPASAAAMAVGLLFYLISAQSYEQPYPLFRGYFPFYLLAGGAIFTASMFRDLHHPLERFHALTLPVSNLERLISRYLLSGPGFYLYAIASYLLFEIVAAAIASVMGTQPAVMFNPSDPIVFKWGLIYFFPVHALLFFGAIFFRSYPLVRTILACGAIVTVLCVVAAIAFRLFYWNAFDSLLSLEPRGEIDLYLNPWSQEQSMMLLRRIMGVLMYVWLLWLSWLCLCDHEA